MKRIVLILAICGLAGAGPAALGASPRDVPSASDSVAFNAAVERQVAGPDDGDHKPQAKPKGKKGRKAPVAVAPPPPPPPPMPVAEDMRVKLRDALATYHARWGQLPQTEIPPGPAMKPGDTGPRVALLRDRLGLTPGDAYDETLRAAIWDYRVAHGLGGNEVADKATLNSLNSGAAFYEELIAVNLDRLNALPGDEKGRYVVVDAASAQLWLYENGAPVDHMKAVVGTSVTQTPMLATTISAVELNPYWNVPPDLTQRIAGRVAKQGVSYLAANNYEVMSDWSDTATTIDPSTVDWAGVARGTIQERVRQLPGADNMMGAAKFVMPNEYGVYLHDTPNKKLFEEDNRWRSNGCIRVEDVARLLSWIFNGAVPDVGDTPGAIVPLATAIPVYLTYLTAAADDEGGIAFRSDRYHRDTKELARRAIADAELKIASSEDSGPTQGDASAGQ